MMRLYIWLTAALNRDEWVTASTRHWLILALIAIVVIGAVVVLGGR